MNPEYAEFRVRDLAASVYMPSFLFAVGQGAVIPVLPLLALERGLSVAIAGAVVAAGALGTLVFDLPAGLIVTRLGEKSAMLVGTVTLAMVAVGIGTTSSTWALFALVGFTGAAWSIWFLARLSYAVEVTPLAHRGRVMSMLGGLGRVGLVIGPLLGGVAVEAFGLVAAFYVQAIFAGAALCALMLNAVSIDRQPSPSRRLVRHLLSHVSDQKRTIVVVALVSLVIQMLRSAREALLPLWGSAIALSAGQISVLFSVMAAAEVAMFYPAGVLSDRRGRKWSAIPCLALLSLGLALVPLTGTFGSLLAVGGLIGVGNGFGAGIQMTLGSDLAPPGAVAAFLGAWRLNADLGAVAGPALTALAASSIHLAFAAGVLAGIGVMGLTLMSRLVSTGYEGSAKT